MGENTAMVHPGTKFTVIYVLVKFETKLYTYKIYCWDSYRIDIAIPKGNKQKEKGSQVPGKSENKQGKFNSISRL